MGKNSGIFIFVWFLLVKQASHVFDLLSTVSMSYVILNSRRDDVLFGAKKRKGDSGPSWGGNPKFCFV